MRADTQTISIRANPSKIVRFLSDPRNLPRWAVGFAKAVRDDGARWVVTTSSGEVAVRVVADETTGVVDFFMSLAPGVEALAGSRVLPNEDGAQYIFTQFQPPGMTEEAFTKSMQALGHELTVLKALLEVECPL